MFLQKVHDACIQYLTPVGSGPPNIGDGCKINLNFEAAGDVNWRLKIRVAPTIKIYETATVAENEMQWRPVSKCFFKGVITHEVTWCQ